MDLRDQTLSLPCNLEAEQDLLGGLLYDNGLLDRVPERLRGAHFHEPFHQRLFDLIVQTAVTGRSAEPSLLSDTLKHDPAFSEFGGLKYLNQLVEQAPPAKVALDSARSVYDLAVRRDLIRIGQNLAATAADPELTSEQHVAKAESDLFALAEAGEQAKGVASFSEAMSGAIAMAIAAYERDGKLTGLSTHLADLDQKLGGLHPSDLLILAGRPSMGKTALATNIAFNVARHYRFVEDPDAPDGRKTVAGGRVFFGSLEMSKEQLALRIISDFTGISNDRIRKGQIDAREVGLIRDARAELEAIPLHIDETGGIHIAKFCARARRQHRKTGLDLIVADYLQLFTTDHAKGGNRVQEVSVITGALKALAKELGVPIIALSQLSRQVESRDDKRPMLSDLRESGSIEQDADCVMFVYREAYYLGRAEPKPGSQQHLEWTEKMQQAQGQAEVIIGKQRHGPIGTVRLAFNDETTTFGNLAHNDNFAQPDASGPPERREVYSFQGDR
ncbi:replicative DNA helicase [Brevundimonas sp. GCM10030266]|uniref:replicative DNA helicase n=1 Tax=Brevundimonas sp. GCM10030266 TaxID=3273386 RepID=UPI003616094C